MMHKKESKLPALDRDPPRRGHDARQGKTSPARPAGDAAGAARPGASWTRQGPAPAPGDAWTGGDMPPAWTVAAAAAGL